MAWPFSEKKETQPTGNETPPSGSDNQPDQEAQFLEKISGRFTELLKPIQEDNKSIRQELETIKQSSVRPSADAGDPADPISEPERWKVENLGPLAVQNILLAARFTEQEVLSKVPVEWQSVVIPQVREMLDRQTPVQKKAESGYAGYVQNCVDLVIGREMQKGGVRRDTESGRYFIEDASGRNAPRSALDDKGLDWVDRKGRVHTGRETLGKLGIDPAEFEKSGAIQ